MRVYGCGCVVVCVVLARCSPSSSISTPRYERRTRSTRHSSWHPTQMSSCGRQTWRTRSLARKSGPSHWLCLAPTAGSTGCTQPSLALCVCRACCAAVPIRRNEVSNHALTHVRVSCVALALVCGGQDNLMEFVQVQGTVDTKPTSCGGRGRDFRGRLVLVRQRPKGDGPTMLSWKLCTYASCTHTHLRTYTHAHTCRSRSRVHFVTTRVCCCFTATVPTAGFARPLLRGSSAGRGARPAAVPSVTSSSRCTMPRLGACCRRTLCIGARRPFTLSLPHPAPLAPPLQRGVGAVLRSCR